jgi:hypothetical protein
LTVLILIVCLTGATLDVPRVSAQVQPIAPRDTLFRTIAALDSALFDAYNVCDLGRLGSYVSDDLEFYHDQTGLARGRQALVDGVRQNVCGKVRRDLVPGTLEVHPLKGYGAVETGVHLFCDPRVYRTCSDTTSGSAKFVTLWRLADGVWQATRVISYDHVSSYARPRLSPAGRPAVRRCATPRGQDAARRP